MRSLDTYAAAKLEALDARALRRTLVETDRGAFPHVVRAGRRLVSFSCNDYLGFSADPRVKAAAMAATERWGAGAGASRLVTGNHPLHAELEGRLAAMKGSEAACLFGSGYLANIGVLGALAGPGDLVLIDALAHNCLNAGAALSGAAVIRFPTTMPIALGSLLAAHRAAFRHVLVVTETVFSMDGDRAPLAALARLAERARCLADGRRRARLRPRQPRRYRRAAGDGHPVEGRRQLRRLLLRLAAVVVDLLKTRARSLIYSTALPPASVAAAIAALDILAAAPDLAQAPLRKARLFTGLMGLPEAQSAIVPLVLGSAEAALEASARLEEAGFLVVAIRPPTVPAGTARLRFAFCAGHADADIAQLAAALREIDAVARREPCPASS